MRSIYPMIVLWVVFVILMLQDAQDYPLQHDPSEEFTPESDKWDPSFASTPSNVSVLEGGNAELYCRVHDIGGYGISWIRHRDVLILTYNNYVYSTNEKFQIKYLNEFGSSLLTILNVQKHDAGIYECQVNTVPIKSYHVKLEVVDYLATQTTPIDDIYHQMLSDTDPFAYIEGGPNIAVKRGTLLNITCVANLMQNHFVGWYHKNETLIDDLTNKGRFRIMTDRTDRIVSQLLIENVGDSDAGTYTCRLADVCNVTVELFVNSASDFKVSWIALVVILFGLNGTV